MTVNEFRRNIFTLLENNDVSLGLYLNKTEIGLNDNDFDIRKFMDKKLMNEILSKGYLYLKDCSDKDTLFFTKC